MERTISRKRPWLAALLGALATGLGHLYLWRWQRAVGWFVALFAVSYAFVDPAAIEALAAGEAVDPLSVAPTLLVGAVSAADAYVLARAQNALAAAREPRAEVGDTTGPETGDATGERAGTAEATTEDCPNCGREVDPEIDFCHWCTAELPGSADDDVEGDRSAGR